MAILAAVGEEVESKSIVTTAYDLAEAYDEELVVLHVIPEDDYDEHKKSIENISDFPELSISQAAEDGAKFAIEVVRSALDEFDEDRVTPRGRVGDPAEEILDEVTQIDTNYLVIGGQRRSPVGKALFGSATQTILLNATVPVVTVMMDGEE